MALNSITANTGQGGNQSQKGWGNNISEAHGRPIRKVSKWRELRTFCARMGDSLGISQNEPAAAENARNCEHRTIISDPFLVNRAGIRHFMSWGGASCRRRIFYSTVLCVATAEVSHEGSQSVGLYRSKMDDIFFLVLGGGRRGVRILWIKC